MVVQFYGEAFASCCICVVLRVIFTVATRPSFAPLVPLGQDLVLPGGVGEVCADPRRLSVGICRESV